MTIAGSRVSRIVTALVTNGKRFGGWDRWEQARLQCVYDPSVNPFAIVLSVHEGDGPWPMGAWPVPREMLLDLRCGAAWTGHGHYWIRRSRGGQFELAFEAMSWRIRPTRDQFEAFMHATIRSVAPGDEQPVGLDAEIERILGYAA